MSGIGPLVSPAREGAARAIARGVTRHLLQLGMSAVPEFVLPNGRRADLVALGRRGEIWIVEIKSSVEDFRTDLKWPEYRPFCDRFYFASHADVSPAVFPPDSGLIVADAFGAEIIRHDPPRPLAGATRKALTIALARLAMARLTAATDPEALVPPDF